MRSLKGRILRQEIYALDGSDKQPNPYSVSERNYEIHTWEKVVFDPWQQQTYGVNDTVTFDPKTDADAGEFLTQLRDGDYLPTWYQQRITGALGAEEQSAAVKAANHANTPTIAHFDTLGRTFLTIADNGAAGKYETRVELDIECNQRSVTDALGCKVMVYDYDLLGHRLHQSSMEAGDRWMLSTMLAVSEFANVPWGS